MLKTTGCASRPPWSCRREVTAGPAAGAAAAAGDPEEIELAQRRFFVDMSDGELLNLHKILDGQGRAHGLEAAMPGDPSLDEYLSGPRRPLSDGHQPIRRYVCTSSRRRGSESMRYWGVRCMFDDGRKLPSLRAPTLGCREHSPTSRSQYLRYWAFTWLPVRRDSLPSAPLIV
jgi:hypothetical protein